jgi:hypothetical protein
LCQPLADHISDGRKAAAFAEFDSGADGVAAGKAEEATAVAGERKHESVPLNRQGHKKFIYNNEVATKFVLRR